MVGSAPFRIAVAWGFWLVEVPYLSPWANCAISPAHLLFPSGQDLSPWGPNRSLRSHGILISRRGHVGSLSWVDAPLLGTGRFERGSLRLSLSRWHRFGPDCALKVLHLIRGCDRHGWVHTFINLLNNFKLSNDLLSKDLTVPIQSVKRVPRLLCDSVNSQHFLLLLILLIEMLDDIFHGLVVITKLQELILIIQNIRDPNFVIFWLSSEKAIEISVCRVVNLDRRYIPLLCLQVLLLYVLFFKSQRWSVHVVDEVLVYLTWRVLELIGNHALVRRHKDSLPFLKNVRPQNHLGRANVAPNFIKFLFERHGVAWGAQIESIFGHRLALKVWFIERLLTRLEWLKALWPSWMHLGPRSPSWWQVRVLSRSPHRILITIIILHF